MKAEPNENGGADRSYTRVNGLVIMTGLVLIGFSMVLLYDYMSDRAGKDLQEKIEAAPKTVEGRVETWLMFGHPQINESLKALRVSETQNWIVGYLVQRTDGEPEVWGIDLDTLGTEYLSQNGNAIEIRLPAESMIARSRLFGRNADLVPVFTEDATRPPLNAKVRELVEWKLEALIGRLKRDIPGVEVRLFFGDEGA